MNILKRPMFFSAIICVAASIVAVYKLNVSFILLAVSFLVCIFFAIKFNLKYLTVGFACLIYFSVLLIQTQKTEKINRFDGKTVRGEFTVISEQKVYDEYVSYILKSKNSDLPNGVKCFVFDYTGSKLKMGDMVKADFKLSKIKKTDKYRLSNYGNSVYATASVNSVFKLNKTDFLYKTAYKIRSYIKTELKNISDGDVLGFLLALTTGDKSMLSQKFTDNIKTTGISHIVVVSGMHLAIIMSLILTFIDRLFYNKYIRCILTVTVVFIISAVCGFTMSVVRAGLMFVFAGLAPIFNREYDSVNSLFTAVTAVLIVSPFAVFNISFQLSVLSTLAIVWVAPFYYNLIIKRLKIFNTVIKTVLSITLTSVFAVIFTLPVTVFVFGYTSIVAPFTNLIITYPVTFALVLNIAGILLSAVPVLKFLGYAALYSAKYLTEFIVFAVNNIAKMPVTIAILPAYSFVLFIIIIAITVAFMYFF